MRALVLIDDLHSDEMLAAIARLIDLRSADLLLAYVAGGAARGGLDLVRRRPPGPAPMPPHRERELRDAEDAAGSASIAHAEAEARTYTARVETVRIAGEPGRAICELAAQREADVVVVRAGGRDRPPMGPASLGPAARFIADHCPVPVLLLRAR